MPDHEWLEGIDPDSLPATLIGDVYYSDLGWGWANMRWAETDAHGRVYWANEERAVFSTSPTMWHPAPWPLVHRNIFPDEIVLFPWIKATQRQLASWRFRIEEAWRSLRYGPRDEHDW